MARTVSLTDRYFCLCLALIFFSAFSPDTFCAEASKSTVQPSSVVVASSSTNNSTSSLKISQVDVIFNSIDFDGERSTSIEESNLKTALSKGKQEISQDVGKMLISLAIVILLGLGIAWFMKRFVVRSSTLGGGKINVIASYTLSPKAKVHLIRVGSQSFLIGEGSSELSLLSELNNSVDAAAPAEPIPKDIPSAGLTANPPATQPAGSFGEKLSQWQNALSSKDMQSEVNTSLLLLGGLTQRLRNKRKGES